ncbi:MAG: hypothetical protein L6R42_006796, partial [Xanthoria sp. 1 TBL-2021]
LCKRRQWPQPHYESYATSAGYACVARVNNREYQTDTTYGSDLLARENAAMRAYLICRNFSVNDGMYPSGHAKGPVIQGLPVAIGTERRSVYADDHDSGSRSGGSSPRSYETRPVGHVSARTGARLSNHIAAKMQVTRRVPSAAHFVVNARKFTAASPAKRIFLQASRVRTADCDPRFNSIASFSCSTTRHVEGRLTGESKEPPQEGDDAAKTDIHEAIAQEKEKQTRAPWHREGSNKPPIARQRSAGAMTKGMCMSPFSFSETQADGKLLTTPSRLLKLIIPLTTLDKNSDRKDVEPLALLVHPQQPLSYLERLIQSELPTVTTARGEEKIPAVHFRAEDSPHDEIMPAKKELPTESEEHEDADLEESKFDGKTEKTGILNRKKKTSEVAREEESSKPLGEGSVESYSGLGREGPDSKDSDKNFVRWSPSTEIGDFIRDAARGKEFAVEIEGAPEQIRIGVPSFNDRTHYLRHRLRKTSTKIMDMAGVKKECDMAAHRGAQRVAIGGALTLVGYWSVVYWLTFKTDLGWDTMEPVTYLTADETLSVERIRSAEVGSVGGGGECVEERDQAGRERV